MNENTILMSMRNEGVTAKVVSYDNTCKTVMIEILTGENAGKTVVYTLSTIKRWWKVVEEVSNDEVDETEEALELLAGGDSVEQANVVLETPEVEEVHNNEEVEKSKKSKEVNPVKIDTAPYIEKVLNSLQGVTYEYYPSVKRYKVKDVAGKTVAELNPQNKQFVVFGRKIVDGLNYKDGYNYYLPVHTFLEYADDLVEKVLSLI